MHDDDRKKMIQKGFDTVAKGYDHPSLFFFPQTAEKLLEALKLSPDQHLLDVCTGTGAVSIPAAQMLHLGKVTGIDLSTGMLLQAKTKAKTLGLENTEFLQMDLEKMTFEEATMDAASISFGLFFLEDMTQGLRNIAHCVKSQGKIALSSFSGDAFFPLADVFIKHYEETGRTVPPLSWKRLSTAELITDHFNAVGINEIEFVHLPLGCQMSSSEAWWDVVWNAGWRSLLNNLSEEELTVFKSRHLAEIDAMMSDKGIWFNTEVIIAVGHKI